jgi:hypothetical protein
MSLSETSGDPQKFNNYIESAKLCLESAIECLDSMNLKSDQQKEELDKTTDIVQTGYDRLNSLLSEFKGVFSKQKILFHSDSIYSLNILSYREYAELNKLCGFPTEQKWQLLYRGSVDGFGAADFHRKCDGKSNTLTIVKSDNGNIFGGYTNVAWESKGGCQTGTSSFLFSLKNQTNSGLKFNCFKTEYSINCSSSYGPTFGGGHDLRISNNSNANIESYSNPGNSYQLPPGYTYGTDQAQNLLAGSYNFKVNEIEVFAKV